MVKFCSRTVGIVGLLALAAAFAACGTGDGTELASGFPTGDDAGPSVTPEGDSGTFSFGSADASVTSLAFDPPVATLTVDGKTPSTASFVLKATRADGTVATVTADALQFDRPDLAAMKLGSPVELTAEGQAAGTGVLHGVFAGKEATAQLTVAVKLVDVGQGVDAAAVAKLNAAGLAQDPAVTSLLYPYDKTVFPLGLGAPLLMWNAPAASDVYRVHLEQKNYAFDGYYAVPKPGRRAVEQAVWDRITASNAGDPLRVTLSRLDVASGAAYASATQSWTIAPASMQGAIYYWTTSAGGHMSRIRPGSGAQPEVLNGGKCMGCHAVSADGTTLVAAVENKPTTDGSGDNRAWVTFGLPGAAEVKSSTYFAGNVALNPNGKYVVFGNQKLKLGETATGKLIASSGLDTIALDPNMKGLMTPAFSPDGKKLVAVEGAGSWYHNLINGKLVTIDFDESTQKFTNKQALVATSFFPAGQRAIAYPSFAPDSSSIAFHVGDYATGCDAQGCDDAAKQVGAIWLQTTSGAPPVKLAALTDSSPNAADDNLALEPTFNPVERGGYYWVVFTSSRDWGNKIVGTANNGKKRLWVAAIDKTTGTADPSHPAFFLEGQEEATTNMRGFWALAQCTPTPAAGAGGGACKAGFECCSGFCDAGTCVDKGTLACRGVGDVCTADADCCNAGPVRCSGGACAPQLPR
jgi:hypothetical protein